MDFLEMSNFYSTEQVMNLFNCSRQRVSILALRESWGYRMIGQSKIYYKGDVDLYHLARLRTKLARKLGWKSPIRGQPLIRENDIDIACPVCGEFAVRYSKDASLPLEKVPWICRNKHSYYDKFKSPKIKVDMR